MAIEIKSLDEIKKMRKAGILVGQTLQRLREVIRPGLMTKDLDLIAHNFIIKNGGVPSFLGYHSYPATICTSVNSQVVHGIPGELVLNEGDIISIDCGAIIDGWHGDSAISLGIGEISPEDQKLIADCEYSMWAGIAAAKVGGRLTDLSSAIEKAITSRGKYGIVREYGGHGIGTAMHQEPHLLNYGSAGRGPKLVAGMALAVEPMIMHGSEKVRVESDEWTVSTIDGSRAAHTEHTFALLPSGEISVLTALDSGVSGLAPFGVTPALL
ncbi:MAG: type I methionyl aminopeptidase [Actinobacteria bacterium]|uniref:Methionine aminopeptidase n=1 Tax=Candidatus Fonsibacter lacus TaxID=2576439 RepID=A0A965GCU9_9PROT|nr:type I methionyl aminopeptidase [Candidatus Fonsibacter lacus]